LVGVVFLRVICRIEEYRINANSWTSGYIKLFINQTNTITHHAILFTKEKAGERKMEVKDFDYKEEAIIMDLVLIGAVVIVLGMLIQIGLNVMANTTAQSATSIAGLDVNSKASANSAIQSSYALVATVPTNSTTVVIAVFGGIAIGAIIGYMLMPLMRGFGGGAGGAVSM
jgi:hypothetical protein